MENNRLYSNRKYVVGMIAVLIVFVYLARLFTLQLMSDEYKRGADSNAFMKRIQYPARGVIYDRNGQLLVYNQPSYDVMVVAAEIKDLDTLDLCASLGITREFFDRRLKEIKGDNPKRLSYASYTQQLLTSQISAEDFSAFQEKLFRFPGFYIQKRTIRQYAFPNAAHLLGDVGEVGPSDIKNDDFYQRGDYIGKQGIESSYEKQLRGEKGVEILLRDARGRIKGKYQNGKFDHAPIPGRNLTLSIDLELQQLGEELMKGKLGSIVAIEPSTGEVLCMVSSPTYDPRLLLGRQRGQNHKLLSADPHLPLLNRAIMGTYPPGSTFKTSQALTFLEEGIITPQTAYSCNHGFHYKGMKVGCHGHGSPLPLVPAIGTSCNGYFCWGLYHMLSNRSKYATIQEAMTTWKDYMVSMGFGYKLGIDLPSEMRGMIPNADYYDKYKGKAWSPLSVISISIGQGEVTLTPLQIANLGATIANRGYYITPHVVHEVQGEPMDTLYTTRHYTRVSSKHYEQIVAGMRRAVESGTCKAANNAWYEVCGKTGTAQNRGHDHSVFMGFAPRDNPQIAVAVYVENGGWGATYGVPIGALIMEKYINGKLSDGSEEKARMLAGKTIYYGNGER